MRLLIFTLALISAFFVSAQGDYDPATLIPAELKPTTGFTICRHIQSDASFKTSYASGISPSACYESTYIAVTGAGSGKLYGNPQVRITRDDDNYIIGDVRYTTDDPEVPSFAKSVIPVTFQVNKKGSKDLYTCPPSGNPEHIVKVGESQCAKPKISDCPAGYHSKAVSKAMGSDSCMPKECPASGTGEDLYSSKLTGGTPFNGGGMYCNDGCAYSVKSENVTSDQYALGTSQGVACGDKPYDNKKLADEGNDGQCETNTVDGVSVMFCNNEPAPPTDKDDDANNDPSKGDETEKPKKELENCASDDNACMMRNLIKEQSNNTQVQIESDTKLHNRMVDTATNNTNVIKSTIENFNTSFDIHARGVKSSQTIELAKLDSIISTLKAGNQIAIDKPVGGGSGGSGGSGNGANEGTCVGEGCSENSKYNGECEGALCDEDIVPKLESVDAEITEWFNEKITIPAEITSSFTNMRNFISSNFASFNGTCTPFTLDVSIAGNSKSITVNQHCEPYETYFKPLVEWLLWTLTAMTLFSMFAQVFRSFSRI